MEAVSRRVTVGQHKSAVWLLIDVVNPVKDFVEQTGDWHRVSWRTNTVINSGSIGHVCVIFKVQIYPVPARWKIDLSSQAVDAIGVVDVMGFWNIVSLVYASETYPVSNRPDIVVRQCCRIVMPKHWVARKHSESSWEGFRIRCIPSSSNVVHCHAIIEHRFKCSIGILIEQTGCPVCRFVCLNLAGGT